jgi:chromosome segregation ATPase
LAETIAAIPEGQQELRETLQAENRRLAEAIAAIPESQQALRETLQGDNQRLAEMIAAIPEGQRTLREILQEENRLLADRIAGLETSQDQLEGTASTLQVLTQTAASSITNIADEQAALHKTLRENIEAHASSVQAAEQYRQAMEEQVSRVDDASQQATAVLAAVRTGQNTLLETIEAKNEELAGQLLALSGSQQTIQTGVNSLEDRTDQTMGEVRAIRDGQTSANEMLQGHAEDVGSQMSALAARGEQIDSSLGHLKELSQAIADRAAGIAREQASLHGTAQDNSQMLADKIEGTRQSIQDNIGGLDEKASQIIADIGSVAAAQSDFCQVVEANDQAAAGKLTALLESQLTFHAGANLVSEKTEHTVAKVAEVAARQAALGEALQAHMEAFNAEIPPLVAGNGQLTSNVNHLRELAQTVADTVTRIADEQTTLQGILHNNTQVLTDNITFNEQNQKTLQKEVNRVAEAGEQTTTAVTGMASEQTELRDLLRTNNEELINQCTVLAESQRALIAGVNDLGERTAEAATKVAGVITGQSSLTEVVQTHTEEITARMSALGDGQGHVTSNLDSLQELAKAVSSNVANMTDEQVALQATIREGVHTLDNGMKDVTQRQQAVEEKVGKVAQGNQETAVAVAAIAAEQAALHRTLETDNREMNDQFASLSEEQHSLRVELSKVAESGQETAAATSSVATHQATLTEVIDTRSEELNRHLSSLSENQQRLKAGIAEIDDKIVQTAAHMGSLAEEQATLHELAQDSAKDASDRADALVQTQRNLRDGLDRLQQMGQDVADQIAQIADTQSEQAESVQRENGELLDRLNTLTGNQGQLHSNVNGLREVSQRVAGQVKDLTDGQVALQETLQDNTKATAENHAAVAHNQQSLQTELNKVAEASRQAAAVVTAMAAEQDTLREMLRTDNEELSGQVTALSQDQQANIEKLSETTQQVVTDLMAVDSRQIKLEETIQAFSEDLVARVATVKQDQERWLEQVDATHAKMHPMWERVEALSQEVVRFQEALQRSVQALSDLLDARNQQRIEFEDRVNQDLTAITESVSRIHEAWGCLQAQVRGKEDGTPTHSEDMAWAIAQLKSQSGQRLPSSNSMESAPGPEAHQPVDASFNIELGGDDKQP